jgi:hypothetical protein
MAATLASTAFLDGAVLATLTTAWLANTFSVNCNLGLLAEINFL